MKAKKMYKSDISIVVVDDEPIILEVIFDYLESLKVTSVKLISDPLKVMDYLRENKVDVVFTDLNMPKLNGLTLAKQIRDEFPEIKLASVSGGFATSDDKELRNNIHNVLDGNIEKPFSKDDFINLLLEWFPASNLKIL